MREEMPRRPLFLGSLLGAFSLYAGCGDDAPGAGPKGGGAAGSGGSAASPAGLPCAVERLLRERCQQCHGGPTAFGAPMSLVTRQDLAGPSFSDPSASTAA